MSASMIQFTFRFVIPTNNGGNKGDAETKGTGVIYNKIGATTPVPFDSSQAPAAVSVYCDNGVDNFNGAVDHFVKRLGLMRVLAQIDVDFSNSMIEAFWRSSKHNCLFQQQLDTLEAIRKWVSLYVQQHNEVMPHHAFKGQTPNEMYSGTGTTVEVELKEARAVARQSQIVANRKRSCNACSRKGTELHAIQLDKP